MLESHVVILNLSEEQTQTHTGSFAISVFQICYYYALYTNLCMYSLKLSEAVAVSGLSEKVTR